jgi:hypothetical protein
MQTVDTPEEPAKTIEEFYLTGLRTDGRSDTPNFFTFLIAQGGNLLPLTADGQVILFTHLDLASDALRQGGIEAEFRSLTLQNVYLVDVAGALYRLERESADPQKLIANTLDLFAKILTTLGIGVPSIFADPLIELGNYVDANEFYGDFIQQEQITRPRAVDAVRWCLGTIFSVARIVTRP